MNTNRLKIFLSLLCICLIMGLIFSQLGRKIEQETVLHNQSELQKQEEKLKELGVEYCLIQPSADSGIVYVLLSFQENDTKLISEKFNDIRNCIYEYSKKSDRTLRTPMIKIFDEEGFPLQDLLTARNKVVTDSTMPEDINNRYTILLMGKINTAINNFLESADYKIRIVDSAKYDVTLDSYSPNQIHFFARFNETNTKKLQAIRILYKKISGFNEARGDTIHFYNMSEMEYNIIDALAKEIAEKKDNPARNTRNQVVFYEPINMKYYVLSNPADAMEVDTVIPEPAPTGTTIDRPLLSTTPVPTISITPTPAPSPSTLPMTPSPEPSVTVSPVGTGTPGPSPTITGEVSQ